MEAPTTMTPSQPSPRRRRFVARTTTTSRLAAISLLLLHVPSPTLSQNTPSFPADFKLSDALNYYHVESASLLKRSLLAAGFDVEDTMEVSKTYLDFATRALHSEARRIERIKDALRQQTSERARDPPSCQAVDSSTGQCIDSPSASHAAVSSPDFHGFLTPDLTPGQTDRLRWQDDGSLVQEYAARVGLPPQLIPTLRSYAEDMGLLDIMTNMLYEDPLPPGGSRFFTFSSPYQREQLQQQQQQEGTMASEIRNFTWNVERPEKKWKSDMHWFNTADELSHEDALRALAKGGFDLVLEAIGKEFGLDHLHVDSVGFVAVTNCDRGFVHTDWEDVDGRAFNFLVGISTPERSGPELIVESDRRRGEVRYGSNAGILVGDGTRHGTRECDHRAERGVRITCSIYLADLNEKNLEVVAGDTTSIFPPTGDVDWFWSQRGRHWSKEGGRSLVGDLGRTGIRVEDEWDDCEERLKEGDCVGDTEERTNCLRTCQVYIHDSVYKPGEERRKVLGY